MTYCVYAFHPLSIRALANLVDHEANGAHARFERYMAQIIHVMASGAKIDADRTERFGAQLEKTVYANPFERTQKSKKMSAAEIKDYMLDKIAKIRKRLKKE